MQMRTYGTASYLASGTSTGLTATTLTLAGANWAVNAYRGYVLIPNVNELSYNYKIIGNTARHPDRGQVHGSDQGSGRQYL